MKRIYLDYASLTPIDRRVLREMKKYSGSEYANPSSIYMEGVSAKRAMEDGRKRIGGFLNAHPDEIIFTSGGTEANSLSIEGAEKAVRHIGNTKPHIITTNIEHSSIIETVNMMEERGVEVTRLAVDRAGLVSLEELKKAIRPNTFLVSIMMVNNEIGTVQPIREIAKVIRHARVNITKSNYPLFHTDAAQAASCLDLNVEQLGVDLMTIDSGKVYGPRGIGALYIRRGTQIEPIIYGGGQEHGMSSGTENLPAVMGFAKALDIAKAACEKEVARLSDLTKFFIDSLMKINPNISINPGMNPVNTGILNISIPSIDNEFFVLQLDAKGVAVSTKSSCLRDEDESYVLKAIGADSKTSVRFSFGRQTKKHDLKKTISIIGRILAKKP
ncbi:MAG: cysteine desulfurase family protein [Candidatus Taylorbacteria bacterium]|nr:cysteine desulfurase family protein [Candidatus Taylorbacteria bacterium]